MSSIVLSKDCCFAGRERMTMMFMLRERKKKKELPSGEAAQNNVFLCSKIRDSLSLIIDVIWPSLQKTRKKICP